MDRRIPDYLRLCAFHRVVDGDTVDVLVDLGFRRYSRERVRIAGIDAPEQHGATRQEGLASTEFVQRWFDSISLHDRFLLDSHRADSFGRWLGSIYRLSPDGVVGESLADALVAAGRATVYRPDTTRRAQEALPE